MRPETKLQKKPMRGTKSKQRSQRQRYKAHAQVSSSDVRAALLIQRELAPGFVIEKEELISA